MLKITPTIRLPHFPIFSKIALGVILFVFFLDYQPTLGFPPLKKSTVKAQTVIEQKQNIEAKSIPFLAQLPHPGYISTHFSLFHPGIDLATGLGMPIHPIAPGTVISTGFNVWGLGLNVIVDHGNGYQSLYAHMGEIYVNKGQKIDNSSILGVVGLTGHTTGPHTHLQVSKDGKDFDPLTILPPVGDLPKPEFLTPVASSSAINTPQPTNTQKPVEEKPEKSPEPQASPTPQTLSSLLIVTPQPAPPQEHSSLLNPYHNALFPY